jgi:hypothetical protein
LDIDDGTKVGSGRADFVAGLREFHLATPGHITVGIPLHVASIPALFFAGRQCTDETTFLRVDRVALIPEWTKTEWWETRYTTRWEAQLGDKLISEE